MSAGGPRQRPTGPPTACKNCDTLAHCSIPGTASQLSLGGASIRWTLHQQGRPRGREVIRASRFA
eukprot:2780699-Pyramimonas_sp.AAC.1